MPNMMTLSQDMKGPPTESKTVPPGEHSVRVKKMLQRSANRVAALYEVQDAGEFHRATFWDSFNLDYERGQEMMSECLVASGVPLPEDRVLDLDACEGKTLCGTVRHKDGWLNVVAHRPDF